MKKYILFAVIIISVFSLSNAFAQEFIDTEGNDFRLTFMPNYHNNPNPNNRDSLYIFISAKVPTSGTIIYKNISSAEFTHNFQISNPDEIYVFAVGHYDYELRGFNFHGNIVTNSQNERIAPQSFHIVTDNDVNVYALNQADLTSEAFVVIPTDALGNNYYVLTYSSDGAQASFGSIAGSSTPSQFAIVATEDGTEITINPSQPTQRNALNEQNITLNAGDVYLVQALITAQQLNTDLTGTLVRANKPIAVFAGHQRARVPLEVTSLNSRDCLIEQMIPISAWGRNAVIVPFAKPVVASPQGNDIFRVLAANDNTEVFFESTSYLLNAGDFIELSIEDDAIYVEASEPILVAQYKKSARVAGDGSGLSDPLMIIVPPVEQYATAYRVINAQSISRDGAAINIAYDEQFLSIVGDSLAIHTLILDGSPVNVSLFQRVGITDYFYANLRVSDGVHNLSSSGKFAVFVYGYGPANSYGYLGGMSMVQLDLVPPRIFSIIDCDRAIGVVTDSTITDSKLFSVTANSIVNADVTIETFVPYKATVGFEAQLINRYIDGQFNIVAVDSVGSSSVETIEIPGFTVGLEPIYSDLMNTINIAAPLNTEVCFDVTIYNYGKHIQSVGDVSFANNAIFQRQAPIGAFLLQPGESRVITFCGTSDIVLNIIDTLIINNQCGGREVAELNFIFKSDTIPPRLDVAVDSCNTNFRITFLEDSPFDFGIESYEIISDDNCKIVEVEFTKSRLVFEIIITDPSLDAFFNIIVRDSVGLTTTISQQIPGFTLSFATAEDNIFDFESVNIGSIKCMELPITNYGKFPIKLEYLSLRFNTVFSVPQSQFPLVIEPNSVQNLQVCFAATSSNQLSSNDTIFFELNCIIKEIALLGFPQSIELNVPTKCDVTMRFISDSVNKSLNISPIPIAEKGRIKFNLPIATELEIQLYDLLGNRIERLYYSSEAKGDINYEFQATTYPDGVYIVRIRTSEGILTRKLIIAR